MSQRIAREQKTIAVMMAIYCRDHHHPDSDLCADCIKLLDYAERRLESCPFESEKPACNHCSVHCYSKSMRIQVQDVMRYAGPRMLLKHPLLSMLHLIDNFRKVPKLAIRKKNNS